MTPRQIHALEWAMSLIDAAHEGDEIYFVENDAKRAAKVALCHSGLSSAWSEYRAQTAEIRAGKHGARRALQTVSCVDKGSKSK